MGNKCPSPCPTTPLTDVKNKFRCSNFCCLKGATINVIHTNTDFEENDTVDGLNESETSDTERTNEEKIITDHSSNHGIYGKRDITKTTI